MGLVARTDTLLESSSCIPSRTIRLIKVLMSATENVWDPAHLRMTAKNFQMHSVNVHFLCFLRNVLWSLKPISDTGNDSTEKKVLQLTKHNKTHNHWFFTVFNMRISHSFS